MIRPVDVLLDFLHAEEARGVTHVHLDEGARQVLRGMMAKRPAATPVERAEVAESPVAAPRSFSVGVSDKPLPPSISEMRLEVPEGNAMTKIAALRAQAENWAPARALGSLRTTMVFSVGNPEADLMLVGEAPGYQEEREQEPFVGPAGQKLNDILRAMGIPRESAYISNIVKFRPAMPGQTTNNRPPDAVEMAACLPFILQEIEIVRPKCIVALGGTAAKGLLGSDDGVGRLRGQWHEFEGVPLRVTYHPSYLLRTDAGNTEKRKVWEDMLAVMERLGMPISEKQRGYFQK